MYYNTTQFDCQPLKSSFLQKLCAPERRNETELVARIAGGAVRQCGNGKNGKRSAGAGGGTEKSPQPFLRLREREEKREKQKSAPGTAALRASADFFSQGLVHPHFVFGGEDAFAAQSDFCRVLLLAAAPSLRIAAQKCKIGNAVGSFLPGAECTVNGLLRRFYGAELLCQSVGIFCMQPVYGISMKNGSRICRSNSALIERVGSCCCRKEKRSPLRIEALAM